jgi:regulator of cell morphogenesis and NO signaling
MDITLESKVAEIATAEPAAIKVFQQHHIDFCCGGKIPLGEACLRHGLDPQTVLSELQNVGVEVDDGRSWETASLTGLVAHIQRRYHAPLRAELPRLSAMMTKVVGRHGARLPGTLLLLQRTFERLHHELLAHMAKEDAVLFPAITALESVHAGTTADAADSWAWMEQPMRVMEAEHDSAGTLLAALRELTCGYTPPADACLTFRGLYHGLSELEREMHVHVHLENNILFPRALRLARAS